MSDDDRPLLRQAASGNTDALAALLKKHAPSVRASISGRIPGKWRSVLSEDDVMQQTYTDAFLDIEGFDPDGDGSFAGWLCRLAQCNLSDGVRTLEAVKRGGRKNRVELDRPADSTAALMDMLSASGTSPSRHAAHKEAESHLQAAMSQLPPTYRQVVRRYDLEGRGVEAIAEELGRSPGAVYMLRTRAHDRLRKLLGATSDFFTDGA